MRRVKRSTSVFLYPKFLSCLILILSFSAFAKDGNTTSEMNAEFFIGKWNCENDDHEQKFVWESKLIMDGQWLSGQTKAQGNMQSLDIWKLNKKGDFLWRKVFLNDGSYAEVKFLKKKKNVVKTLGSLQTLKVSYKIKETLKIIDDNTFQSKWEKFVEGQWQAQGVENCKKDKDSQ